MKFFQKENQATDTSYPFFTHWLHLNKGCTQSLKCNLVNFEVPKLENHCLSLVQKSIWDLKIDKITFQTGVYILYSSRICVVTG